MKANFKLLRKWGFLFISIIFFSCEKDPSSLGLKLLPESDAVNGQTIQANVSAYTLREDSLTSDERTYALLGSYKDPVFGQCDAGFMTQIRLSSSNVSFGNIPTADSIVLYLDYRSYYGDTNTLQSISVFELKDTLKFSDTYYSNLNPNDFGPLSISSPFSYYPRPNDTVVAIKLNKELADRIVATDSTNLKDNTAFLAWFNGIYLKVDPITSGGAIIYYNLLSTRSKVTLYYHNAMDTLKYDFLMNSSCAMVNLFSHDYSSSTIISINDSLSQDSLLYLQAMSGLMAKIKFPNITGLKDSITTPNPVIIKAELIIPTDNSDLTAETFKTPSKLLLVSFNSLGKYEFVPDYYLGDAYFGGYYYSSDHSYHFNISRYIQELMDKTRTDYGLGLIVNENRVSANRVILKSPLHTNGMKLIITYLKP